MADPATLYLQELDFFDDAALKDRFSLKFENQHLKFKSRSERGLANKLMTLHQKYKTGFA